MNDELKRKRELGLEPGAGGGELSIDDLLKQQQEKSQTSEAEQPAAQEQAEVVNFPPAEEQPSGVAPEVSTKFPPEAEVSRPTQEAPSPAPAPQVGQPRETIPGLDQPGLNEEGEGNGLAGTQSVQKERLRALISEQARTGSNPAAAEEAISEILDPAA